MKKQLSIIIPVLREADIICRILGQFSDIPPDSASPEIIIVDGDKKGGTIRSVTDPRVKTAVAPEGRALQMNLGASMASGQIFLFLHADTLLPAGALAKIVTALSGTSATWGAFELGIASNRSIYRLIEAFVRIRTRITRIPYGDQAIFLTKGLFHRVGGYPEIPIMEDVALVRRLKKQGAVMCMIPEKVSTSPRRWEREGLVYCTIRNWLLLTCFMLGARPENLAKYYRSKRTAPSPENSLHG